MADQKPNDSRGVSRCGGGYEIVSDVAVIREWTELHGSHTLAVLLELNAGELLVVKNTGAMGFFRWGSSQSGSGTKDLRGFAGFNFTSSSARGR